MDTIYSPIIIPSVSLIEDIAPIEIKQFLTAKEYCEMCKKHFNSEGKVDYSDGENYYEDKAKILDNLILIGDFKMLKIYCNNINVCDLKSVLNLPFYSSYYGNRLHTLLYHTTGEEALKMYVYLREKGAEPFKNYYDELPYNQAGTLWTNLPVKYDRNPDEFLETYEMIKNYELGLTQKNQVICHCNYHSYHSDYGYTDDGYTDDGYSDGSSE